MQQLYNRYRSGDSTDERLASFGAAIPGIGERARDLLE
jgi:hypothetical protein